MTDLRTIQKRLAAFALLIILAWVLLYFFWIRQMQVKNAKLEKGNLELKTSLSKKTNKQLNPSDLLMDKEQLTLQKQDNADQVLAVFNKAEQQMKPIFDPYGNGETFTDFKKRINYLVYKTEYISVKAELRNRGIHLYDRLLNLYEENLTDLPYRHYVQLKLVHDLLKLSKDNRLDATYYGFKYPDEASPQDKKNLPARVTVLPVKHYVIDGAEKPFMEVYPVKIVLRGSVSDLNNYILALTGNRRFMPLEGIEIKRVVNKKGGDEWDGIVEAEIVCSAMHVLIDKSEIEQSSRKINQRVSQWKRGM